MPQDIRNSIEEDGWSFKKLDNFNVLTDFDCDDSDLNDYFKKDAIAHREALLTETYQLKEVPADIPFPVGLVSLCNDAVDRRKVKDHKFYKQLPSEKQYPSYPAVKIARLGIHIDYQKYGIASHIINLIKKMFISDNRTGCRLITVDAYNQGHYGRDDRVLRCYLKNDFQFFNENDVRRETRAMFFDLKRLVL